MTKKKPSPYAPGSPAAATFASHLRDLPTEWVTCRDMRHAWATLNDFHVTGKEGGFVRVQRELICMRCETVRYEVYDQTRTGLDKVSQSYGYPDGYQLAGVPRGVKPQAIIQQEQYRRAMEKVAGAARNEREAGDR